MCKISIVMPVYNASIHIAETLNSVAEQNFDDYELIAVNDGSTDNSVEILNNYADKINNMQIITQKNAGPSAARNTALKAVKGEFVFFLDADDLLLPNALNALYNAAIQNDAELVIAKYFVFSNLLTREVTNINNLVLEKSISKYDKTILWTFTLWNKLFKTDVIRKCNLTFPDTSYSEDGVFVMNYVYHTNKISGLNEFVLKYRKDTLENSSSITSNLSLHKLDEYNKSHSMILEDMTESLLKDYPKYQSLDEVIANEENIRIYLEEFYYKMLTTLYNQFYRKFWLLSVEVRKAISDTINNLIPKLSYVRTLYLFRKHNDIANGSLVITDDEMLSNSLIGISLYGNTFADIADCYYTLATQNVVASKIYLPSALQSEIPDNSLFKNVVFIDGKTSDEFYYNFAHTATEKYMFFANKDYLYGISSLQNMYKLIRPSFQDYVTSVIHSHEDESISNENIYTTLFSSKYVKAIYRKTFEDFKAKAFTQGLCIKSDSSDTYLSSNISNKEDATYEK